MRHLFTAIVAAIEAGVIALAGLALIALPTLLVGIVTLSLEVSFLTLGQLISAIWLFGHGSQLHIEFNAQEAYSLGLTAEALSFEITLIPMAIALITSWFAWGMGRRFESDFRTGLAAVIGASLGFFSAGTLIAWFAGPFIQQDAWVCGIIAALWFIVPAWIGMLSRHIDVVSHAWFRFKVNLEQAGSPKLGWAFEPYLVRMVKLSAALGAALVLLGSLTFTLSLITNYVDVVSLTQSMHLDAIGILVFFVAQLAYLPTFILWGLAWLSGSGFAIGTGSSVTPYETLLGPLPSVPVFAAIPDSWGQWGFLTMIAVVAAAFIVGLIFGGSPGYRNPPILRILGTSLAAVIVVGLGTALAMMLATGSLGPGRLQAVGPQIWEAAGFIAAELLVGLIIGITLRRNGNPIPWKSTTEPQYFEIIGDEEPQFHTSETADEASQYAFKAFDGETRASISDKGNILVNEQHSEFWDTDFGLSDADSHDTETLEVKVSELETDGLPNNAQPAPEDKRSRIADPDEETHQPWFYKAVKFKRNVNKPVFDEEELIKEFSWETRPDPDDLPEQR